MTLFYILVANVSLFVWEFVRHWFSPRLQREKAAKYVREWDPDMRKAGFVVDSVEVNTNTSWRGGRLDAHWRHPDGRTADGSAPL